MPTKIKADIDVLILTELGLGLPNKEIAKHFNVSPSYVSKLKNGKKIPYVYFSNNMETDGSDLLERICKTSSEEDKHKVIVYLQNKIAVNINEIKILTTLLNIIKKEDKQ